MRYLLIIALVLACGIIMASPAQAQQLDPDVKMLSDGNTDFGLALYQRLAMKDGNIFFSPYSISNAFGMCYAGARGNTATEMKATLRFNLADPKLHPAWRSLIAELDAEGKNRPFQLSIANRLWGQQDYGFLPEFLKIGKDYYGAGLEELDFRTNPEQSRKTINAWVEKQTRDKIKNLIPQGEIMPLTRLVLTNAIYFKAAWSEPFQPESTKPGPFHLADGKEVMVPMMHGDPFAGYADFDTFSLLRLPYVRNDQSMLILMPKKADGLKDLEKQLTSENLAAWLKKLGGFQVDLKMPKFKVTQEVKLNQELIAMGMKDAFIHRKANFTGMATGENLSISAVLHKAFVDVNEAGTEAAAATAIIIRGDSKPPRATFHADRPFVFLIRDHRTDAILFVGRVINPQS